MFTLKNFRLPQKALQFNTKAFLSFQNLNFSHTHSLFFSKEITLENKNIKMVALKETHLASLRPILLDKSLWIFNPTFVCANEEDLKNYIDKALEQKEKRKRYPFVIFRKSDNKCAGTTSFYNISFENQALTVGYTVIGKEFQKTGINGNSKFLLFEHAFDDLGMKRVEFLLDTLNQNSVVSLLKMGLKHEGILRSNILTRTGRRRDTTVLSLLEDEWPKVKERLLKKLAK